MSACIDDNGGVWAMGLPAQVDGFGAAQILTEAFYNSVPSQLLAAGMTCDEVKDLMQGPYALSQVAVIKDFSIVPAVTAEMVVLGAGTESAGGPANIDGTVLGIWTFDGSGFHSDIGEAIANVDFVQAYIISTITQSPSVGVLYEIPILRLQSISDFDNWFCCVTAGACCSAGLPPAPGFLIPAPTGPRSPVEEKSSVPPLYTPLSLTNHTFQFSRDFGKVGK